MDKNVTLWEKIKALLIKIKEYFLTPRFLFCFLLAWLITNGWSYIGAFLGRLFHIEWLTNISLAWLAMLWLPFTPEKIITFMIAMVFSRLFFPKDEKTFNMLAELKKKAAIKKKSQQ